MQDPELSINQALVDYKRLGYSDNWINQRLKSIEIRKDLTDEWKRHGLQEGVQFATLTDIIYQTWSDMTAKEYKQFKGLKKENLRDNMTNKELVLNMLAELSTKEISESKNPETFREHMDVAEAGGEIARTWLLPILRVSPASSSLLWIAAERSFTPSGYSMSFRFRCVRVGSAFLGMMKRSMWAVVPLSEPCAFSMCKTTKPIYSSFLFWLVKQ